MEHFEALQIASHKSKLQSRGSNQPIKFGYVAGKHVFRFPSSLTKT